MGCIYFVNLFNATNGNSSDRGEIIGGEGNGSKAVNPHYSATQTAFIVV